MSEVNEFGRKEKNWRELSVVVCLKLLRLNIRQKEKNQRPVVILCYMSKVIEVRQNQTNCRPIVLLDYLSKVIEIGRESKELVATCPSVMLVIEVGKKKTD